MQRLLNPFREFGLMAGMLYILDRIFQSISPHLRLLVYELMVQPVSNDKLMPARTRRQIEVREIPRGDPAIASMPAREDIKDARFRQGAVCLGAFRGDVLVGYVWLCFDRYDEDEVKCTYVLSPSGLSSFDFDFYIFPEFRMGRAFGGLWDGVNEILRGKGVRWTFSRITRFNTASRNAHARLGALRVGTAVFLRICRLEVMCATKPGYFHVSVAPGSRATLMLDPGRLQVPVQ